MTNKGFYIFLRSIKALLCTNNAAEAQKLIDDTLDLIEGKKDIKEDQNRIASGAYRLAGVTEKQGTQTDLPIDEKPVLAKWCR